MMRMQPLRFLPSVEMTVCGLLNIQTSFNRPNEIVFVVHATSACPRELTLRLLPTQFVLPDYPTQALLLSHSAQSNSTYVRRWGIRRARERRLARPTAQ